MTVKQVGYFYKSLFLLKLYDHSQLLLLLCLIHRIKYFLERFSCCRLDLYS